MWLGLLRIEIDDDHLALKWDLLEIAQYLRVMLVLRVHDGAVEHMGPPNLLSTSTWKRDCARTK